MTEETETKKEPKWIKGKSKYNFFTALADNSGKRSKKWLETKLFNLSETTAKTTVANVRWFFKALEKEGLITKTVLANKEVMFTMTQKGKELYEKNSKEE